MMNYTQFARVATTDTLYGAMNEKALIERGGKTTPVGFLISLCREQLVEIHPNAYVTFYVVIASAALAVALYHLAERELETILFGSQENECEALNEPRYKSLIERGVWTAAVGFPASSYREQVMKIYPNATATFCMAIASASVAMTLYRLAEREIETIFINSKKQKCEAQNELSYTTLIERGVWTAAQL